MTAALLFGFGDVATEVDRRLAAEHASVRAHVEALRTRLPLDDAAWVDGPLRLLDAMASDATALGRLSLHYRLHAIRVAAVYLRLRGPAARPQDLELALLHNLLEVGGESERALFDAASESTRASVAVLTIERERERVPGYLAGYYEALRAHDLILFKGCDKLDNHLTYVMLDLDDHHYDLVRVHLCPHLAPLSPALADYLQRLLDFSQDRAVRARYRRLFDGWKECA